jgi:hypothetical protein
MVHRKFCPENLKPLQGRLEEQLKMMKEKAKTKVRGFAACVCARVCARVRVHVCTCVRVYVCTCVRVYVCTCVRVYVCTCVRVYVCTCVRVYVYSHAHPLSCA